jgi:hypothetical protein
MKVDLPPCTECLPSIGSKLVERVTIPANRVKDCLESVVMEARFSPVPEPLLLSKGLASTRPL